MALRDNLVSWWELNETSGTRYDSHGTNHLTDVGAVSYGTGKKGNAADIEADSGQRLDIADASQTGLDITGDMSLAGWVQFESQPNQNVRVICSKSGSSNSYDFSYYFMNWDTEAPNGTRALAFWIKNNAGSSDILYKTYAFSTATWYHVAVSWVASTGTATFYINGSSIGTDSGAITDIKNSAAPFSIGGRGEDSGYPGDGLIDELAVWSKALTGSEITELYNSGNGLSYAETGGGESVNSAFFAFM